MLHLRSANDRTPEATIVLRFQQPCAVRLSDGRMRGPGALTGAIADALAAAEGFGIPASTALRGIREAAEGF